MNAAASSVAPTPQKRTVSRGRRPNAHYRRREYLTEKEIERLMKAAGDNRYGHRDATMILLAFRHGLRASELCSLRWEQVDLTHGRLHVTRAKNGIDSVHPLSATAVTKPLGSPRRSSIACYPRRSFRRPFAQHCSNTSERKRADYTPGMKGNGDYSALA
jgi:integrase